MDTTFLDAISGGTYQPLRIYLWVIAVFYFFGAIVHVGNMAGYGEMPYRESPLAWRIGDPAYALIDAIAVIGLIRGKWWGVAAFVVAALSQLVLYIGVPGWFAFTPEQRSSLQGLVVYHLATLTIYGVLLAWALRR